MAADGDEYELRPGRLTDEVIGHRARIMVEAGYDPATAIVLAENPDVDVRQALKMLADGCSTELAVRILA
jgi:hypothetical protein